MAQGGEYYSLLLFSGGKFMAERRRMTCPRWHKQSTNGWDWKLRPSVSKSWTGSSSFVYLPPSDPHPSSRMKKSFQTLLERNIPGTKVYKASLFCWSIFPGNFPEGTRRVLLDCRVLLLQKEERLGHSWGSTICTVSLYGLLGQQLPFAASDAVSGSEKDTQVFPLLMPLFPLPF